MANITVDMDYVAERPGVLNRVVSAVLRSREVSVQARRAKIKTLEAKSDAELAEMGLRRDDIAYYVFRDLC